MFEAEVMSAFAQFGVAGLIGLMWLSERRASAERDRQIGYAHRRLKESQTEQRVLIDAIRDSTRAMVAIETGQRALVAFVERELGGRDRGSCCRSDSNGKGAA